MPFARIRKEKNTTSTSPSQKPASREINADWIGAEHPYLLATLRSARREGSALQNLLRHPELDTATAARLCQRPETDARELLSVMERDLGYLERGGGAVVALSGGSPARCTLDWLAPVWQREIAG